MKKKIEAQTEKVKEATAWLEAHEREVRRPLSERPRWNQSAAQTLPAHFFGNVLPCESCGAASGKIVDDADPYDRALRGSAGRLVHHAQSEIRRVDGISGAGMLREAALLLDLLHERRTARDEARDARKLQSGKASRS